VCTKPALIVPQVMDVKYVARMMISQFTRRVVVLESGELVGLVTMNDIVGSCLRWPKRAISRAWGSRALAGHSGHLDSAAR